jgi:hypothetical protein
LGYIWSNLLLACSACNNRKRNNFPIAGLRIDTHPVQAIAPGLDRDACLPDTAVMTGEQPLLINPEIDPNPMQHFRFQADGSIEHKTAQGENTIRFCNLKRGALVAGRKKLYDRFFNRFVKYFDQFDSGQISEQKLEILLIDVVGDLIEYINNGNNEYLEFAKTCWNEFENFFIARFPEPKRQRLANIFTEIRRL